MSTLDGHDGGNQEFETFDIDSGSNNFSLEASQEVWAAPKAGDRVEETVSKTMGYSGEDYPISENFARTCTDACSRPHRQADSGSIPWNGGRQQHVPTYDDYRGGQFDRTIPMSSDMNSLVVIQKGSGQSNGYGGNRWGGWNQPYDQGGDSKTIVVQGGGSQVYDNSSRVRVGETEVVDETTVVGGRHHQPGHGQLQQPHRRSSGIPGLEGFTPKETIGLIGAVGEAYQNIRGGGREDVWDNPYQNNPYRNRGYRYGGPNQNRPGNNRTIIVQGGGGNVYDRSERVRVGDTEVSDEVTIVNGRQVGTPPYFPNQQQRGWTPKEFIGLIGAIGETGGKFRRNR